MADIRASAPEKTPFGPRRIVSDFTDGGHEIDRPPNIALFGVIGAMSVLIILTAIGVFQLFVHKADEDNARASSQPSMLLANQAARDDLLFTTWGEVVVDGEVVAYRMPVPTAKALVLAAPERLSAAAPPQGWAHPDDTKK
ncbi:MAG: hypothetical protein CSA24_02230 [Deltaproteobacteria bacterium]|nr:MAG: hypothetical protein CSA24_02230 [Deltaproteobacteria bacterium]